MKQGRPKKPTKTLSSNAKKSLEVSDSSHFRMPPNFLSKGAFGVSFDSESITIQGCSNIQRTDNLSQVNQPGKTTFPLPAPGGKLRIYLVMTFSKGYITSCYITGGEDWWEEHPYRRVWEVKDKKDRTPFNQSVYYIPVAYCDDQPYSGAVTFLSRNSDKFYYIERLIWSDLLLGIKCDGFIIGVAPSDSPCVGSGGGGSGTGGSGNQGKIPSDGEIKAALLAGGILGTNLSQFSGPPIDPGNPLFGSTIDPAVQNPTATQPVTTTPSRPAPTNNPVVENKPTLSDVDNPEVNVPVLDDRYPNGTNPNKTIILSPPWKPWTQPNAPGPIDTSPKIL